VVDGHGFDLALVVFSACHIDSACVTVELPNFENWCCVGPVKNRYVKPWRVVAWPQARFNHEPHVETQYVGALPKAALHLS